MDLSLRETDGRPSEIGGRQGGSMDWLTGLKTAIDYMEEHLLEDIGAQEVADAVYLSPFYFQKCFKIITGYSIGEYLRNRRLGRPGGAEIQYFRE